MTPAEEKIEHQRELLTIKSDFLSIGYDKMPLREINSLIPKGTKPLDAIKWSRKASNVWNGRSMEFETYLPIFRKAFEILKDTEQISA